MAATPPQLWRAGVRWHDSGYQHVEDIRCGSCRALLLRAATGAIAGAVQIKCRRCGTFNTLRPIEPVSERRERPTSGEAPCTSSAGRSDRPPSISATPSKS
ncbi:Com family DNA-binding transcriptional regulator [Blastochloris tepida]|uniref:Com family DNA-binding transcriptional regulator n=1 Tax=Blastochloris tepida TaxID=2233851 RepID=A0A348FYF9_9HYPH|nr:hypothetical protein BLTE_10270 [Blastochloris tepida]